MTAVARFVHGGCPILVGDLLLSGEELPGRTPTGPTIEAITDIFPVGSGWVPVALAQKIALITDKLVIGWSGTESVARGVFSELIRMSSSKPFTSAWLDEYFDSLGE